MTKILVVDDTPDMAKLISMAVRDQGYDAITASNGRQALQMASTEHPDAILLDVMMPQMSGIEVLRKLKEDITLRMIPVLLVTAKSDDDDVVEGLDAGAHDYVTKPFKREILAARLRSAVRVKEDHDRLVQSNAWLEVEIAERKKMEKELARSQKLEAIGHLAAGIAHEINTPAQYVGDNTRFFRDVFVDVDRLLDMLGKLLQATRDGNPAEELIAEVDAAIRQADVDYLREEVPKAIQQSLEGIEQVANIVRAMKEFSHPGNGQKQPIGLNRAIQSILTISHNEWKFVADLVTDFSPDLPPVPCLPGDLNQVILNLVVNAAQAIATVVGDGSHGKGTITVRTRCDEDWVEIRIEDTGTGIPESIRDNVFDQFFTTKEVGKGTGLGLSIAHSIVVQKHGGTINFETEEGKGTAFIVRLPLAKNCEPDQAARIELVEVGR